VRRAGELMGEIEPAKNQHDASAREGAHPSSRTAAPREAGFSDHQRKQASGEVLLDVLAPDDPVERADADAVPPADAGLVPGPFVVPQNRRVALP
jgi:hypothetical protein